MDDLTSGKIVLPAATWRDRPGLDRLAAALGAAAGEARYVGGAVRDTLLGLDVADIDIATRHAPAEVIARLEAAGIKAVPTGIEHGTITAVSSGTVVEVTTLRRDVSTDGRRATVAFTDDWREDAARRDFTMNALYADPLTGELFDWFGGLGDLAAGRVRFIGDPYQRIAEDHLRILRFFRFHARFGDAIDAAGLAACTDRANDLMALSRERIAAELLRLLVAANAVPVVALMIEYGIFRPALPEVTDAAALAALAAREAAEGVAPDAIRRLAALIAPDEAEGVGARLKLSNADRKRLQAAHDGPGDEGPRALAYRVGLPIAIDRLLLAGESVAALRDWTPPRLPIGGGEIVARGVAKGPEVARLLRAVEDEWIARGFPDAAETAAIVDQLLSSRSSR
ncbi:MULTISPECIES: CCA tRNA nucleotidyltransferase [unclassified Sphingomonas]|uniref:CCA tRNA nucleotidyltransferase n=1 Tax=unclassified Sphingomonas TaxID=196159 RepID=UPI000927A9DA|nr:MULTISPECIES: CCA tRNA nucleotidyltransferase [unclassified Sphingomonas]MBN8847537.1 CCA tRNA nucleotidyltransferase [Sphingomonas sp.]OJV32907.1 MAG: polynucleotide adenylyltransferase [Sphingomonas sp. 67-36]